MTVRFLWLNLVFKLRVAHTVLPDRFDFLLEVWLSIFFSFCIACRLSFPVIFIREPRSETLMSVIRESCPFSSVSADIVASSGEKNRC